MTKPPPPLFDNPNATLFIDAYSLPGAWKDSMSYPNSIIQTDHCSFKAARIKWGTPLLDNRTKWQPSILTAEFVLSCVEESNGKFFWRARQDFFFFSEKTRATWNKRNSGKRLKARTNSGGYSLVGILQVPIFVHRLVWLFKTKSWPVDCIDHINGDRLDNRAENLRDVPRHMNSRNRKPGARSSGRVGVFWDNKRQRWCAHGAKLNLGRYKDYAEALSARERFEAANGYTDRHCLNVKTIDEKKKGKDNGQVR